MLSRHYSIATYSHGFIVNRRRTKKDSPEVVTEVDGYFTTLQGVARHLMQASIATEAEKASLKELVESIPRHTKEVAAVFERFHGHLLDKVLTLELQVEALSTDAKRASKTAAQEGEGGE